MLAELAFAALQIIAQPTDKVAWDVATEPILRYEVRYDLGTFVSVGMPPVVGGGHVIPLPALSDGSHTVEVRACGEGGCSVPTALAFSMVTPPPPPPTCVVRPSVFVTRTTNSISGLPGSLMQVHYQIGVVGKRITLVEVLLNGSVVRRVSAQGPTDDLTAFGMIWITTPLSGSYELQVRATDDAGCAARTSHDW
jgi:hypothetical protein